MLDQELETKQVDIVALQQTRFSGSGYTKEENYTFYWSGGK